MIASVSHPNFGYTLDHMSIGGGIAVVAIAIAVTIMVVAFIIYAVG